MEDLESTEDLVNEFRFAKGDLQVAVNMRGKISHAIPKNNTILKEFIEKEIFPKYYEIYGVGFLELQNAFRSPWGVRSSAVLLEQWGVGVSNSKADSIYQSVCRMVGNNKIDIIQYVVEAKERRNYRNRSLDGLKRDRRRNMLDMYRECLDRLVEVMDEERERVFTELK